MNNVERNAENIKTYRGISWENMRGDRHKEIERVSEEEEADDREEEREEE